MYQVPHHVAWFDLDYGGNPEGIFTAACPPEALHALENGIYKNILLELFKQILKPTASAHLDKHVKQWCQYLRQRFLRSFTIKGYPRLLYTSGISKLSDLKADDKLGIIFCIVVAGLQQKGRQIFLKKAKTDNNLYRNIIYVFELMLCYRAWLKRKTYWKYEDDATMYDAQKAIEQLLNDIVKLMPRSEGNAWAIPKIHEQLHIAESINIYGKMYIQDLKSTTTLKIQRNHVSKSNKTNPYLIGNSQTE